MIVRRLAPALALFAVIGAALAGPVEDLTKLVQAAANTPNPAMAFLSSLARMGDFDLRQADIKKALAAADLPADSPLTKLLGPTTRLRKQGDRLIADRSRTTAITMDDGKTVQLGRQLKARLTVKNNQALIDDIDGIKVGNSPDELYDLWKVRFFNQGGRPKAEITAGALIFSKTFVIDLTPRTTASATPAGVTRGGDPAVGINAVLRR